MKGARNTCSFGDNKGDVARLISNLNAHGLRAEAICKRIEISIELDIIIIALFEFGNQLYSVARYFKENEKYYTALIVFISNTNTINYK